MDTHDLSSWLDEFYEPSFRTAVLILDNQEHAAQVVQEALLRAWRFRASLGPEASLRPWLFRVLVNSCCTRLAQETERHGGSNGFDQDEVPPPMAASGLAGEGAPTSVPFATLGQLPLHLRVPLVLRYFTGLTEREVALAVGRRQATVKARLLEARKQLAGTADLVSEQADHPTRAQEVRR